MLRKYELQVHVIHGNNMGDLYAMSQLSHEPTNDQDAVLHMAGRAVFLVRYPHHAAAMALTGDFDLVCCGHDHRTSKVRFPDPDRDLGGKFQNALGSFSGIGTSNRGQTTVFIFKLNNAKKRGQSPIICPL